jgi:signal transduction histidine kinase
MGGAVTRPSFNKLYVPAFAGSGRDRESVPAAARAVLALGSIAALHFGADLPRGDGALVSAIPPAYLVYSVALLLWVRWRRGLSPAAVWAVHVVDIVWPALFSVFVDPRPPFFALCLFALLTAAYRWGFWETVGTAAVAALLFQPLRIFCDKGLVPCAQGSVSLRSSLAEVACLLALGVVIGYLAQQKEERPRARALVAERILAVVRPESRTREMVEGVLQALGALFGCTRILLAVRETATGVIFLWQGEAGGPINISPVESGQGQTYFHDGAPSYPLALRFRKIQKSAVSILTAVDDEGKEVPSSLPEEFVRQHDFASLLAVAFPVGEEWQGRLFLFEPARDAGDARFLQDLIQDIVPALHGVYLLRRLRQRAQAAERTRIAREMHDGVIQSLVAAEMEVEALRHGAGAPADPKGQLDRAQLLVHESIMNLRDLMERSKTFELRPGELVGSMADIVDKFRRETGISARFSSQTQQVALPPHVCGELARIVQEALVNVRKHSRARHVFVRFALEEETWKLVVEDDGQGFGFVGRLTHGELDAACSGPAIIKERARSIGAQVVVESRPGRGVHLEVRLPQKAYG